MDGDNPLTRHASVFTAVSETHSRWWRFCPLTDSRGKLTYIFGDEHILNSKGVRMGMTFILY